MKKLDNKTVGLICLILGGIFFLSGIVLFILSNKVNLYAQKTEATIMSRYEVDTDEPYTMLELVYRVGDEMVNTTDSFRENIPEDQLSIEIYYDIRNPERLLDGGWNFIPLATAIMGLVVIFPGLYYMNILTFGIEPAKKPDKNASKIDKEYYEAREKMENDYIPLFGAVCFTAFGIIMLFVQKGWWQWIFIGVGALAILYVAIDIVPATSRFLSVRKMKKMKNIKVKTVVVDDDFEQFEENEKEEKSENEENSATENDSIEVEETFEIKKSDLKKKKKRK